MSEHKTLKPDYCMQISNPHGTIEPASLLEDKKSLRELFADMPALQETGKKQSVATLTAKDVSLPPRCSVDLPSLPHPLLENVFTFLRCEDAEPGACVDRHWNQALTSSVVLWKRSFARWLFSKTMDKHLILPPKNPQSREFWNDYNQWKKASGKRHPGVWKMYYMLWIERKTDATTMTPAAFWKFRCQNVLGCCTRKPCTMFLGHPHCHGRISTAGASQSGTPSTNARQQ